MRIRAVACGALLLAGGAGFTAALAAEDASVEPVRMETANNNIENTASLQRGAKYFVNYCFGCHSAEYVRYNKLAEGLHLTNKQLQDNLMFTGSQPFDTMSNAMSAKSAQRWFGQPPPDLSLIARSRGTDYIYNYLRSFYKDDKRPTGANNLVLPNTAMPDVLWELQGIREPVFKAGTSQDEEPVITGFKVVRKGLMTEQQFDQAARDITNFLDYIGEPTRERRETLGLEVIAFLLVFALVTYLLKKEIWKDVE